MSTENEAGIYGRALTSRMMKELDWHSFRILDFFEGIWRDPGKEVFASNAFLADKLGISDRTVKRAIAKLKDLGYITCVYAEDNSRTVYPGGTVKRFTASANTSSSVSNGATQGREQPEGQDVHGPYKTYKDKNPISIKEEPPSNSFSLSENEEKLEAKRKEFLRVGKVPAKHHKYVCVTELERDALIMAYEREGLDLEEGLDLLTHCAKNNTERFLRYDCHYAALTGWVMDAIRKKERERLYLENARTRSQR